MQNQCVLLRISAYLGHPVYFSLSSNHNFYSKLVSVNIYFSQNIKFMMSHASITRVKTCKHSHILCVFSSQLRASPPAFFYQKYETFYYLILEIIFLLGNILFYRYLQLSPICGFVQHNLCQEYVLSNITYAANRFCPT